jgi:ABC-type antimicrobial peptide transport system permease subunit
MHRHEFGVRRALGAATSQVMREVFREGMGFAVAGGALGLIGAALAARLLQGQLYAVRPWDPITYVACIALILSGSALACWIPAHRAIAISPMDALRTE